MMNAKEVLTRSELDRVTAMLRGEPQVRRSRDQKAALEKLRRVIDGSEEDRRGIEEPRGFRKSSLAGKKFVALVEENVRREGSHGYHSLQIIIDNPMITYEDFLAKGGRRVDLAWDLEHKNVRMRVRG